jgi:hypothetical protein
MSGSWTHGDEIALAEGLCHLGGGNHFAQGLHDWRAVPFFFFQLNPGICLATEEKPEADINVIYEVTSYLKERTLHHFKDQMFKEIILIFAQNHTKVRNTKCSFS